MMRPTGSLIEVTNGIKSIIRLPLITKSTLRPTTTNLFHQSTSTFNSLHSSSQHVSNSSSISTFKELIDLLGGGIFRSVRSVHSTPTSASSPTNTIKFNNNTRNFTHKASQSHRFTSSSSTPSRNSTKTLFSGGLRAPSLKYPTHQAHKGLGTSRKFSSGSNQSYFQNIIENVPLGLRALGDSTTNGLGIDDRKWKRDVRGIRRGMRTKGVMRVDEKERNLGMKREFENYFGLTLGGEVRDEVATEEKKEVLQEPVTLILYLTPDLNILSDYLTDNDEGLGENLPLHSSQSFSLLKPTPLDLIQSLRDLHAKKLSTIQSNLLSAGVLEDEENTFEFSNHQKELKITFGPNWERRDVEQVLGDYNSYSSYTSDNNGIKKKGRGFYEIKGQDTGSYSTCPSSPNSNPYSLDSSHEHEQQHDLIASQFYLPSPHSTSSSLNEISNYNNYDDDISTSWSLNGWESHGLEWDFGTSPSLPSSSADHSVGESSYHSPIQSTPFSFTFSSDEPEQEEEEDGNSSSGGSESDGSRSYERGVQNFLGDLEDVERELEWRRARRGI